MSHSKEREEKICLNCGAQLTGRYCSVCGQENTEPRETVWGLVSHFFNDITHFDGKFFSTVKYLITRPGFLSAAYIKGKRASYLHPIRMYVFISAFFFIIFFSAFNPETMLQQKEDREGNITALTQASTDLQEKLTGAKDSVLKAAIQRSINHINGHAAILKKQQEEDRLRDSLSRVNKKLAGDSLRKKASPVVTIVTKDNPAGKDSTVWLKIDSDDQKTGTATSQFDYRSRIAYDSVQKELPAARRDSWFKTLMERRFISLLSAQSKNDKRETLALMEKFMHMLPQALFVSLPVFALIVLMLYARRKFYYVDHAIFTIHLYCATFIILLVYFGINKLQSFSGWHWLVVVKVLLALTIFFYLYKAMRNFYGQGRGKTILKFLILNLLSSFFVLLLIVLFFFLSLIQFA